MCFPWLCLSLSLRVSGNRIGSKMQQEFFLSSWDHSSSSQREGFPSLGVLYACPVTTALTAAATAEFLRSWDKRVWKKYTKKMTFPLFTLICWGSLSRNRGLFLELFLSVPSGQFQVSDCFWFQAKRYGRKNKSKIHCQLGGLLCSDVLPQCLLPFIFQSLGNCSMLSVQGCLGAFNKKDRAGYIYSILTEPRIPYKFFKGPN